MSTPTYTYTTVDGVEFLTREEWCLDGELHRADGPAYREWEVVDGQAILIYEQWYLNGKLHANGPALRIWVVVDGHTVLTHEVWYWNGKLHRVDGPAWRRWEVVDGVAVLNREKWYHGNVEIHPRILRQPVRAIERWWRFHQSRRQEAIEELLWESGMKVFPGLMGLLREC